MFYIDNVLGILLLFFQANYNLLKMKNIRSLIKSRLRDMAL